MWDEQEELDNIEDYCVREEKRVKAHCPCCDNMWQVKKSIREDVCPCCGSIVIVD
jgi:hypothetical protein